MKITLKHIAAAIVLVSIATLGMAYTAQYGFGLEPCPLCLYQRKPYFINIALGVLAFVLADKNKKAALFLLFASALVFLVGAGIAGFHAGVEYKWWKGLESCESGTLPGSGASIEELREAIMNRNVVRCDVPAWTLFGISMAGYNFMASLFYAAGTFFVTFRNRHGQA
jgi:disulfide bond formation protein DsbB